MSEPMELRGVDLVVIPAYQPSALLLDLVKDVTAAGYGAVVVDDGSTMDRQWIFAQLEALPAVVVLHHPQNRGRGAALKTAFQTVWTWNDPTAYLVTMDADGQHLPQDAERLRLRDERAAPLQTPRHPAGGSSHSDGVPGRAQLRFPLPFPSGTPGRC